MGRCLVALAALYACGHPGADGLRPALLNAPLQGLHRDINQSIVDGRRAMTVLNDARSMRYLAHTALVER